MFLDITAVAALIKKLDAQYHFEIKVIDSANKQAVAELNNRHGLNLIGAEKHQKADHILLMNDDFIQGHIQLVGADLNELEEEYEKLVWLTDASGNVKEPKKENPLIHQDLCDAAYYSWRYAYHYLFKPREAFKDMNKQEVWEPLHLEKLIAQAKEKEKQYAFMPTLPQEIPPLMDEEL